MYLHILSFSFKDPRLFPVFFLYFMFKVQDVNFLFKLPVPANMPAVRYHTTPIIIDSLTL